MVSAATTDPIENAAPPAIADDASDHLIIAILAKAHPLLREALFLSAISPTYDVGLMAALRNRPDGDDDKAIARLADFSFVRPVEAVDHQPARYRLHGAERRILERQFIAADRAAFLAAHQRALTYFESHPDPDPFLHDQACLYHRLIIEPEAGAEWLTTLFRQYVAERRLAAAERLTAMACEAREVLAALQSPRLAEYDDLSTYLEVRLAQYQGHWTDSAATLQALRAKAQLTDRLLPYVARAYGDTLANAEQFIEAIEQYEAALAAFRKQPHTEIEQAVTLLSLGDAHVDLAVAARSTREVIPPRRIEHATRWDKIKHWLKYPIYLPLLVYLSFFFGRRVFQPSVWPVFQHQDWIIARLFGLGMRWYRRASDLLKQTGAGAERLNADERIAELYLTLGDAAQAVPRLEAMLRGATGQLSAYRRATVQAALGQAWLRLRHYEAARDQLTAALPVLESYGDVERQAKATGWLAEVNLELGEPRAALPQLSRALKLYLKQDHVISATEIAERLETLQMAQGLTPEERTQATTSAGELIRRRYRVRFQHPILRWFRRLSLVLLALCIFLIPLATIYVDTGSPIDPVIKFRASALLDPKADFSPTLTQSVRVNVTPTHANPVFALRLTLALFLAYLVVYTVLGAGVIARTPLRTIQAGQAHTVQIDPLGVSVAEGATIHLAKWGNIRQWQRADLRFVGDVLPDQSRAQLTTATETLTIDGNTAYYPIVCQRIENVLKQSSVPTIDLSYRVLSGRLAAIYFGNLIALTLFVLLGSIAASWLSATLLGTPYTLADLYPLFYLGLAAIPVWWLVIQPLRVRVRLDPRNPWPWIVGGLGVAIGVLHALTLPTKWVRWLTQPDLYPVLLSASLVGSAAITIWRARSFDGRPVYALGLRRLVAVGAIGFGVLIGWQLIADAVSYHFTVEGNAHRDAAVRDRSAGNTDRYVAGLNTAVAAYTRAIDLLPANAAALQNRGVLLAELNRFDESVADYTAALNYTPDSAPIYIQRALVQQAQQRSDAALADFESAVQSSPRNAAYYAWSGAAYHALDRLDLALENYQAALRLDSHQVTALMGQGWVYFEQADLTSRDSDKTPDATWKAQLKASAQYSFTLALDSFARATQVDNLSADIWLALGYADYRLGNYLSTLTAWERAVQLAPNDPAMVISRGTVHWKIANIPIGDRCSNAQTPSTEADKAAYAREIEVAIKDFDSAIKLDPGDDFTYRTRAQVKYLLRDCPGYDYEQVLAAAIAEYGAALRIAPNEADYWQSRARLGYVLARHIFNRGPENDKQAIAVLNVAIADINRAMTLKPDDPANKTWHTYIAVEGLWRFYLLRGWNAYLTDHYAQAITDSLAAASFRLTDSQPIFNAGLAALALGDSRQAEQLYDSALQRATANKDGTAIAEALGDLNDLLAKRLDLASAAQPIVKKLQDGLDKLK